MLTERAGHSGVARYLDVQRGTTAQFAHAGRPRRGVVTSAAPRARRDHAFGRQPCASAPISAQRRGRLPGRPVCRHRTTQTFGTLIHRRVCCSAPRGHHPPRTRERPTRREPLARQADVSHAVRRQLGDTDATQILVFDRDGNLLPDVTMTSESGTVYPLAATAPGGGAGPPPGGGVPAPAPSTLLLMSAGLAGLLGSKCRRATRRHGRADP